MSKTPDLIAQLKARTGTNNKIAKYTPCEDEVYAALKAIVDGKVSHLSLTALSDVLNDLHPEVCGTRDSLRNFIIRTPRLLTLFNKLKGMGRG